MPFFSFFRPLAPLSLALANLIVSGFSWFFLHEKQSFPRLIMGVTPYRRSVPFLLLRVISFSRRLKIFPTLFFPPRGENSPSLVRNFELVIDFLSEYFFPGTFLNHRQINSARSFCKSRPGRTVFPIMMIFPFFPHGFPPYSAFY